MARVPSYYPPEGWNSENFRSEAGLRLLRDLTLAQQRWKQRGIRRYKRIWQKLFEDMLDRIVRDAMNAHRRDGGKDAKATVNVNPMGDTALWGQAIDRALRELGIEATVAVTPVVEDVTTGLQDEVTSMFDGRRPSKTEIRRLKPKSEYIAQQVTNITDTTRARLQREIQRAIDDRLTIVETVKRLRKRFPQIASNRIPTIARTEMGRAADRATIMTLQSQNVVTHISVVGCRAIEKNSPVYKGVPTCNIQDVPIEDAGQLTFHPNHTGTIVSSRFREPREDLPSRTPPPQRPTPSNPTPAPSVRPPAPARNKPKPKPTSGSGVIEEVGDIAEELTEEQIAQQKQFDVARKVDDIHASVLANESKVAKRVKNAQMTLRMAEDTFDQVAAKQGDIQKRRMRINQEAMDRRRNGDIDGYNQLRQEQAKLQNDFVDEWNSSREAVLAAQRKVETAQADLHELLFEGLDEADVGDWKAVKTPLRTGDKTLTPIFREMMNDAKDFIDRISARHTVRFNEVKITAVKGRAYFQVDSTANRTTDFTGTVGKVALRKTAGPKTMVHELMHAVEYANPDLVKRSFDFLRKRAEQAGGASYLRLSSLTGKRFGMDEIALAANGKPLLKLADESKAHYAAKLNRGGSHMIGKELPDYNAQRWQSQELMTIGTEMLYSDPIGFARSDPEFFKFVLGNLRNQYVDDAIVTAARQAE